MFKFAEYSSEWSACIYEPVSWCRRNRKVPLSRWGREARQASIRVLRKKCCSPCLTRDVEITSVVVTSQHLNNKCSSDLCGMRKRDEDDVLKGDVSEWKYARLILKRKANGRAVSTMVAHDYAL